MNETVLPYPSTTAHIDTVAPRSAVSWGAIIAGATAAAALSLVLLVLGTGLGLAVVSPWAGEGASAKTVGISSILWVCFIQLASAALGGYLAGRLRTRWAGTHTDEIYFRDTAHGFLAWALATIVAAALLTSAITGIVSGTAKVGATAGAAAAAAAVPAAAAVADKVETPANPQAYFVDMLFRREAGAAPAAETAGATATPAMSAENVQAANAEAGRIMLMAMTDGSLAAADTRHIGQLVAQRTGMSQADAEKRVTDTFARMQAKAKAAEASAREAADQARKASTYTALGLVLSLVIGAFVASFMATWGGRQRDLV